jgi:hypothetical protein
VPGAEANHAAELETYLGRLEAALAALPADERREILLETRSHVLERTRRAPTQRLPDLLAELGAPEAYACQFLPDDAPAARATPPGRRGSTTLVGLAELTTRGWRALPLLLVFGAAYALAGIVLLFVLGELVDPIGTGVFVDPRPGGKSRIHVLVSSDGAPGRDVLGRWLLPIGLAIAGAIHLVVRALLRLALRRGARHP